jgi:hypothetical protein
LRTPPGQECSSGSLILFAVVLWRAFAWQAPEPGRAANAWQNLISQMKLLKVKTARFSQVVEKSGKPEVYTLWKKPAADHHFQSQVKNNRVMTILKIQSGTDFCVVGFEQRRGATYLVFPKSLKRFAEKRIIGVDWALLSR